MRYTPWVCCDKGTPVLALVVALALMALPVVPQDTDAGFDPMQAHPNMPADHNPEPFSSDETNHMQYYQDVCA